MDQEFVFGKVIEKERKLYSNELSIESGLAFEGSGVDIAFAVSDGVFDILYGA